MSSIFSKFLAASKDSAQEVGEFNIDTNEIRFYTQEIETAKNSLMEVKRELAQIPDKEIQCERDIECLQQDIDNCEIKAVAALNNGNDSVAEELAGEIAELNRQIAAKQTVKAQYSEHAIRLKVLMKKAERSILEHERELAMIKTTDSVQKATRSITQSYRSGATALLNAKNSLQIIKKRQQTVEHRWAVEESLEKQYSSDSLTETIQAAHSDSNDAIHAALQRIRKRAGK